MKLPLTDHEVPQTSHPLRGRKARRAQHRAPHSLRDLLRRPLFYAAALVCAGPSAHAATSYIQVSNGQIAYGVDAQGYKIPDFSHAGYLSSNTPVPTHGIEYDTKSTLTNPSGDETARVQKAIDTVSALPVNAHGYRGAVTLGPGTWTVDTLCIKTDGVVLRGAGPGKTILRDEKSLPAQTVCVGLPDVEEPDCLFDDGRTGTKWNITTAVVNVGDSSFDIASGHSLRVGDPIVIEHPCTSAWLSAIDGGAPGADAWQVDEVPIRYHRYVTAVSGTRITVDAPVMYSLVRSRSQCFVFKYTAQPVQKVGVENLSMTHASTTSLANSSLRFNRAENCWVRHVEISGYKQQGLAIRESTRITVDDVQVNDPCAPLEGGTRYGISLKGGQLILVKNCSGRRNRHTFIGGGHAMDSGNVWLRCVATDNYAACEDGHQRWSNGTLFDNCLFRREGPPEAGLSYDDKMLWMGNHGDNSNGHGWASCTGVVYRCTVSAPGYAIVAKPPTGMNYVIASTGDFRSDHSAHGDYPGALAITTSGTLPESLFEAQLAQRRGGSLPVMPAAPTGCLAKPGL